METVERGNCKRDLVAGELRVEGKSHVIHGDGTGIRAAAFDAPLDANRIETISPNRSSGVSLIPNASMLLVATNNVLSGGSSGFRLEPDDDAGLDALFVNNTIDDMASAAILLNPIGGTLVAGIFNNLLTRSGFGISSGPSLEPAYVVNDYNGYWANTTHVDAPLALDPHASFGSPAYTPGTLRPVPRSPVVDRGLTSAPGLPLFDFAGDPRILGDAVDLGAYEVPEPGAAAAGLAALLALGALCFRRDDAIR